MGLDAAVYADAENQIAIAKVRIGNLDGVVRLRESIKGLFRNFPVNILRQTWDKASLTAGGRELGLDRRPPARFSSPSPAVGTTRRA